MIKNPVTYWDARFNASCLGIDPIIYAESVHVPHEYDAMLSNCESPEELYLLLAKIYRDGHGSCATTSLVVEQLIAHFMHSLGELVSLRRAVSWRDDLSKMVNSAIDRELRDTIVRTSD